MNKAFVNITPIDMNVEFWNINQKNAARDMLSVDSMLTKALPYIIFGMVAIFCIILFYLAFKYSNDNLKETGSLFLQASKNFGQSAPY